MPHRRIRILLLVLMAVAALLWGGMAYATILVSGFNGGTVFYLGIGLLFELGLGIAYLFTGDPSHAHLSLGTIQSRAPTAPPPVGINEEL